MIATAVCRHAMLCNTVSEPQERTQFSSVVFIYISSTKYFKIMLILHFQTQGVEILKNYILFNGCSGWISWIKK